jgi:hypothetical protein
MLGPGIMDAMKNRGEVYEQGFGRHDDYLFKFQMGSDLLPSGVISFLPVHRADVIFQAAHQLIQFFFSGSFFLCFVIQTDILFFNRLGHIPVI